MKSFQKICGFLILIVMLGVVACTEDDELKQHLVTIQLQFPDEIAVDDKSGYEVMLRHKSKGFTVKAVSNENGMVSYQDIEPGLYTFSASISTQYLNRSRVLNGVLDAEVVSDYSNVLDLNMAVAGRFVISQFYYSGFFNGVKLNYVDQFIEIYNNSNDTLYADGLSIVEHESDGKDPNNWKVWEPTHIVVGSIWTIPGDGTDVPVYPGKSLVIATNGKNHKSDIDGTPNSPVDLGNSDFEYYLHTVAEGGDNDYLDVPNLFEDFATYRGTRFAYDTRGGSAMALAWLPKDREAFIENNLVPYYRGNKTLYCCKIPNEWVEDAVEVVMTDRDAFKRFDPSLDAGTIAIKAGSYSALCIRRKIAEVKNERNVLKDTNNSTLDFDHDVVPVPRLFEQ